MKKDAFRQFVRSIILEVKKEKEKDPDKEGKGKKNSYLDNEKPKYRRDVDNEASKTVNKLVTRIKTVVSGIDKGIKVVLDDHNDIMVTNPGMFKIRVKPKWSGMFDVEAYRNMSDRIYAIGLSNEQVLNFIRVNFVEEGKKSYVQTAHDKAIDQTKDASKRPKDLPKGEKVKEKEVPDKEVEDAVSDKKDQPNAPMSVITDKDVERQEDHGVEKNKEMPKIQKMVKKEVDDDLTKSWKK